MALNQSQPRTMSTEDTRTPEEIAAARLAEDAQREADAAADKRAREEDTQSKINMQDTGDAVLDDGHSTIPIKQDPFNARKLIYKKVSENRETTINKEAEAEPDVQRVREAVAAASETNEEVELKKRTSDFDTNSTRGQREEARVNAREQAEAQATADTQGVDDGDKLVTVTVLGNTFEVPKRDVDAEGGLVAYQKQRAADEQLRLAAKQREENAAQAKRLEEERLKLEEQRRKSAESGSTTGSTSTQPGDAGKGDVAVKAQQIVDALYSGDRAATREAIKEILTRPGSEKIDAAEIARQAAELAKAELREASAAPAATQPAEAKPVDPETAELNAYMAEKYGDILSDDTLRAKALAKFNELRADPANKHRRLKDLGRDAGDFAKKAKPHPRQEVVERKQTLPPVATGTQAHTPPAAPSAPSNSSHVERMRKARGLPTS